MKDPDRHIPPSLLLRHVLWIEFQGASTRRNIHVMRVDPELPIATVNLITQIQDYDDWRCEIVAEESLGIWGAVDGLAGSEISASCSPGGEMVDCWTTERMGKLTKRAT
jgi:hypothetical protein